MPTIELTNDDHDDVRRVARAGGLTPRQVAIRAVQRAAMPSPQRRGRAWGVYTVSVSPESTDRAPQDAEHGAVPSIEVDEPTATLVRFAARVFGVKESEVVARAVRQFSEGGEEARAGQDPWQPVEVYGEYEGRIVTGKYLPATRRLTVTSEPLEGSAYKSPSGAARAVVGALNPGRSATQTNGWRFWHLASTHERLEVLR